MNFSYLFRCLYSIVPDNITCTAKIRHDLNRYNFSNDANLPNCDVFRNLSVYSYVFCQKKIPKQVDVIYDSYSQKLISGIEINDTRVSKVMRGKIIVIGSCSFVICFFLILFYDDSSVNNDCWVIDDDGVATPCTIIIHNIFDSPTQDECDTLCKDT